MRLPWSARNSMYAGTRSERYSPRIVSTARRVERWFFQPLVFQKSSGGDVYRVPSSLAYVLVNCGIQQRVLLVCSEYQRSNATASRVASGGDARREPASGRCGEQWTAQRPRAGICRQVVHAADRHPPADCANNSTTTGRRDGKESG